MINKTEEISVKGKSELEGKKDSREAVSALGWGDIFIAASKTLISKSGTAVVTTSLVESPL